MYIYIHMIQYRLNIGNSKPISRFDNLGKKTKLKKLAHMYVALIGFTNKRHGTRRVDGCTYVCCPLELAGGAAE